MKRSFTLLVLFGFLFHFPLRAQESSGEDFYYNNFDNNNLGATATRTGASTIALVSATPSGYQLAAANAGTTLSNIRWNFFGNGTGTSLSTKNWEWEIDYSATANGGEIDKTTPDANSWRYWLTTTGYTGTNGNNTLGVYLTHSGTSIRLRYKTSGNGAGQFQPLCADIPITNGVKYQIRVVRSYITRQWKVYVLNMSSGATTPYNGNYDDGSASAVNYRYSYLESNCNIAGRYTWDDLNMYAAQVYYEPITAASNGITPQPISPGQTNVIPYGIGVNIRGDIEFGRIRFTASGGNPQGIYQSGRIYKSLDASFSTADIYLKDISVFNNGTNQIDLTNTNDGPQYYYSSGNRDGSLFTSHYYFLLLQARNPFNPAGTTAIDFAVSPTGDDNYASFFQTGFPVAVSTTYDWNGNTSSDWTVASNWTPNGIPGPYDVARVGSSVSFNNQPTISAGTTTVGSVTFGVLKQIDFTINGTLNVNNTITQANAANADIETDFLGTGAVIAKNVNIGTLSSLSAAVILNTNNTTRIRTYVNFTITSDLIVNSYTRNGTPYRTNNSGILVYQNTTSINSIISTHGSANNISGVYLAGGGLKFTGPAALDNISTIGKTVLLTAGASSTIEYNSDVAQKVYPAAASFGQDPFANPNLEIGYSSVRFTGAGTKTVLAGDFKIKANWNSTGGKVDATTNAVNMMFYGTTQTITDNGSDNGNGVFFKNVTFSGGGTKTFTATSGGKFSIAPDGIVSLSGNSTVNAGGILYLKSSASSSATVASIPAGSAITGDAFVERFMKGGSNARRGYRLVSSPVRQTATQYNVLNLMQNMYITGAGGVANGFDASPNNGATIYKYKESNLGNASAADYTPITSVSTDLFNQGQGMYLFYRGKKTATDANGISRFSTAVIPEDNVVAFKGNLIQNVINFNLSYTPTTPSNAADGFNLVGNPYASTIDVESTGFATDNPNLRTFYYLDPSTKQFTVYLKSGATNPGLSTSNASRYIASGQGFFVKATATGQSIRFNESHKVNNQLTGLQLLMGTTPIAKATPSYFKLAMESTTDTTAKDDIVLNFNSLASSAYVDGEDAFDFGGNGTTFLSSLSTDQVRVAINTLPAITSKLRIPIVANSTVSGDFTFAAGNLSSIDQKWNVFLVDHYKADSVKLNISPSYSFAVNRSIPETYAANRFEISFEEKPSYLAKLLSFTGSVAGDDVSIAWKPASSPAYDVTFTLQRSVDQNSYTDVFNAKSDDRTIYSFRDLDLPGNTYYYRLKQEDVNGYVSYSAVLPLTVNTISITEAPFKLYPIPFKSNYTIDLNLKDQIDVNVRLIDIFGKVVQRYLSKTKSWNMDASTLPAGTYIIEIINNGTNELIGRKKIFKGM
ncbi:T9SS type A sorting domain-containing protein [Pedobacter sandarakinus]|uniref:T9SS type A sorting domain-containing protein n=1 Tax=Pedobacter sandarakinus TaxID=353156 RepID=UPI0022475C76|nr:T9SS type A sorting domain-containing protein [Pedobacter sandarakinus]MCX2575900.1 T9SS type A sorting domain-containing protein [Pedobacter sandarakinus]